MSCEGVPVWILDSGSGNHLACEKRLPDELRESVRRNATMVRMATANGPATATDVVDVEVPGLDAHARVLLLKGCPSVLSLGRLVEWHKCSLVWNNDGAALINNAGRRHERVVRNYIPFLGQDYAVPAPDTGTDDAALEASANDFLVEIKPERHDERGEEHLSMIHDLTHLYGRHYCGACQAKIKMSPAKRKNPHLRERPTGWPHTLLADHLSASNLKVKKTKLQDVSFAFVRRDTPWGRHSREVEVSPALRDGAQGVLWRRSVVFSSTVTMLPS